MGEWRFKGGKVKDKLLNLSFCIVLTIVAIIGWILLPIIILIDIITSKKIKV